MEEAYFWEQRGGLLCLYGRDIYYVHSERRRTYVHTRGSSYMIRGKLRDQAEYLKELPMIQIHGSYLIHMRYLMAIENNEVVMRNGERLPVSQRRKRYVVELVKQYVEKSRL